MRLTLKEFQQNSVLQLLEEVELAHGEAVKGKPQAIVFSAPTGSGKTVMAMALMEGITDGHGDYEPDEEATFLWITDQPELNRQTAQKFEAGSTVFDDDAHLVTVEAATFDQELFEPGVVYFLNTQKLGKNSGLTQPGNERTFTIWDTIANTIAERPASFWLIIDEAHRGTQENGKSEDPQSLVQKLIKGSEADALPAVPLILGISATPERFLKLLEGQGTRTQRMVTVDPEDVRSSGLLKESITLYHADEKQPSDMTLLGAAASKLAEFQASWSAYAEREDAPEVNPVLVVQVEDGTQNKLTKTDMDDALSSVEAALGPLKDPEIGHCFQEGGVVEANGRGIRYVAPSDVESDPHLRVVFFKMALTTGWDCPRAEVMMSFRAAKDETYIAQLVGRMVRTPLAESVSGDELLDTVALYLPNYDRDALDKIVARLSTPDPDLGLAGTTVKSGNKLTTLKRNPDLTAVFDGLGPLPIYKAQPVSRKSALRRYITLGRELAWDGLEDKEAVKAEFAEHCISKLKAEHVRVKSTKGFKKRYEEAGRIDVRMVKVKTGTTEISDEQLSKLPVLDQNIDHAHEDAGRILGGGLHAEYVSARFADGGTSLRDLKRELWALISDPDVMAALEAEAQSRFDAAYEKHKSEIADLSDERRQKYRILRQASSEPPEEEWAAPEKIEGPKDGKSYDKHLYVRDDGNFGTDGLKGLEPELLAEELQRDDLLGWLRNEDRKQWSFSIAYERGGEWRTMYPDFLVFRDVNGAVVCDVLEPHTLSLADSVSKAVGLARFANKHGDRFGRIELIDKLDGKLKRLALHDPKVCKKVLTIKTEEHLREQFEGA